MKVFPYVLMRIAGGSMNTLMDMQLKITCKIYEQISEKRKSLLSLRQDIDKLLYDLISSSTNSEFQNYMLQLKRNVYNSRPLIFNELYKDNVPCRIQSLLEQYEKKRAEITILNLKGEEQYNSETRSIRESLIKISSDKDLRNGLMLSSTSLLDNLEGYLTGKDNKKNNQAQSGLLRYLTRMCAKTSPFSYFTSMSSGMILSKLDDEPIICFNQTNEGVKGHIRLNNYLFAYIKELITHIPEIRHLLHIRINSSVIQKDNCYSFLANYHNAEAFQKLSVNELREAIINIIEKGSHSVPLKEIILTLNEDYLDADFSSTEQYIINLISCGFLEWNIPVSGTDPDWDTGLVHHLKGLDSKNEYLKNLIKLLEDLRDAANVFGKSDNTQRRIILNKAFNDFRSYCITLLNVIDKIRTKKQESAENHDSEDSVDKLETKVFTKSSALDFRYKPEQLIYEDTTLDQDFYMSGKKIIPVIDKLSFLFNQLKRFEVQRDAKERLYDFFISQYSSDAAISLMQFYEDYYSLVEIPLSKKKSETSSPIHESASIKEREQLNNQWSTWIGKRIIGKSLHPFIEVHICQDDLKHANELYPDQYKTGNSSYGAFLQLYQNKSSQLMAILNSSFPGYGKLWGRFLHLFPSEITTTLKDWNTGICEDTIMVENRDASYFNANIHPPLLSYEISVPEGHSVFSEEKRINALDIYVTADSVSRELKLSHHQTGKKINILDLGLQNINTRSPLFQLLERFTPAQYIYASPLTKAVNKALYLNKIITDQEVWQFPRIIFDNTVVLQRRSWKIKKSYIPIKSSNQNDWNYFSALNDWRKDLDIPQEVFISITTTSEFSTLSDDEKKYIGKDDYKPQYISFQNPHLVTLFEKLARKAPRFLIISEMLPHSEQLLSPPPYPNRVTEFVFQWYDSE